MKLDIETAATMAPPSAGVFASSGALHYAKILARLKLVKLSDCTLGIYYFAGTTSDKNGRRMFRSDGAGSNIPKGLSSRRAVPILSGINSTSSELRYTLCLVLRIR